jgi:hypothetical protein
LARLQTAEFERSKINLFIQNMDQLAESRLQRDDVAMMDAADAIEALRNGARKLNSKMDQKGEGAGLVGLLRRLLKGDQGATFSSPDPNVCSIDLALYDQASRTMKGVVLLTQSRDAKLLLQLRKRYKLSGPLDPGKLPSPDREEAIWLLKAVGNPIQRGFQAAEDWANLLWYAKASRMEYQSLRNDIINGGGSSTYDYDMTIKSVYSKADPPM